MNEPTDQQQRAIKARGNVLVTAGAGAGKTRTLVERCLAWIVGPEKGSVDEILMVTFTEAAATEMRQRLRQGLEEELEKGSSARLLEQLALLETAHISTLHGFCFHLLSQHFFELKSAEAAELTLDGPLNVLSAERSRLLASEAMDAVLDKVYDGKIAGYGAMQDFIKAHGADWDKPTREIVRKLHDYRHSLRDPEGWLAGQRARFSRKQAEEWSGLLMEALESWRGSWTEKLNRLADENSLAAQCYVALAKLPKKANRAEYAEALEAIQGIDAAAPRGATGLKKSIKDIFSEARFLHSLMATSGHDPLQEDWSWARASMLALLDLTEAYGRAYERAKRAVGGVDFQDLEQFALQLLWRSGERTEVAAQWQKKFRLVFVDEFQDINDAQDEIIRALSREGAEANRFLVGDVKQSIYGFRLADPGIFRRRKKDWEEGDGTTLELNENFRSHEGILDFANALFLTLMRPETGGERYDEESRLKFGDRANRSALARTPGDTLRVELHVQRPAAKTGEEDEEPTGDVERQAQMIAARLRELKGTVIQTKEGPRTATWSDMALLLRSPRNKVDAYVKAFARLGAPLLAARNGFYDTIEARDILNLLKVFDNPLQDLPLLGALRSPFGGFTPRELALVRIGREKERFWTALTGWLSAAQDKESDLYRKAATFLERYRAWRRLARQSGVSASVESALDQTHYTAWIGSAERGLQGKANVERFLQLTREFDAERGEGLSRFLRMVETQQENEIDLEPGAAPATDAVRLMSIHQSKGLEFPIVAVGDLEKRFNQSDANGRVIVDETLGLCPQIKAPGAAQFYPSLPFWLAQERKKHGTVGEELRLLYVAVTRAREWLILAGTASEKTMEHKWPELADEFALAGGAWRARCYLDWVGGCLTGQGELTARTVIHQEEEAVETRKGVEPDLTQDIGPDVLARLDWEYPHGEATEQAAKTSVSALRRQNAATEDDEARVWISAKPKSGLGGAEIGAAHHVFLEAASLERLTSAEGVKAEIEQLAKAGLLSDAQKETLDVEGLAAFWESETGGQVLAQRRFIKRELAFTARFGREDMAAASLAKTGQAREDGEFVVVQGVVDLAVIMPEEIWIIDFKTDRFAPTELADKVAQYRTQVELYGAALERIYKRPVSRLWLSFLRQRQVVLL